MTKSITINKKMLYYLYSFMAVYAVCLMLGGIWVYNQWKTNSYTYNQHVELIKYVDENYADKGVLLEIMKQQNIKFVELNKKLGDISIKTEQIYEYVKK